MASRDGIDTLRRAAHRASRRAWLRLFLARAVSLLPLPLSYAVIALTLTKVLRLSEASQRPLWLFGILPFALFVVGVARVLFRARAVWGGSLALDEFHALQDRVTTALAFSDVPEAERTPLMKAAIEDGIAVGKKLDPSHAVPLEIPRETLLVALLLAGLSGLSLFEVRVQRQLPAAPSFEPMMMSQDDIDLFRDVAKELQAKNDDPDALVAVRKFNQLVEDIAQHRLDRHEVFQRMGDLERDLKDNVDLNADARDEGLKGLARELEKSGLTKPASSALDEKRLADAEKALRELAEKLKKKDGRPSAAELDKLRQALEKAARVSEERLKNIEQRRSELEEEQKSLLKKKGAEPDAGANTDPKLADNQRRLEHLDRERSRTEQSQKQMSELDKQLAQAARDLMKDSGQSAEDLQQGAQDINRMARQEASEEQKKELLRKLQEMRELMRQQGKGGKEQMQRLQRFGQRARGQPGSGGEGAGEQPEAKNGGQKQEGPLRFGNNASGPSVDIPVPEQVSGQGPGQSGDKPGSGTEPGGGMQAGTGHDPNIAGNATDLKGKTMDVTAAGVDSGQGTASSQVIYGAAERGFVGRGYKQVFTDYQTVEERALSQDEIPSGYRFYVRRYFQLIRPRE
ncbi:MAG TPA: hypothetical protein VHV51_04650 [Polyangiaceae bacterium]|jgi:hypothetical protein|nr:hypothetical protein [Polyangiaceae bacterium]